MSGKNEQPVKRTELKRKESPVEQAIREAMERGDFDNLPGKGRPVHFDPTEMSNPIGYATKVRKNAGIGAPWEDLQREIEASIERAEREIISADRRRRKAHVSPRANVEEIDRQWHQAVQLFHVRVKEINSKILTFNLKLPQSLPHLFKRQVRADEVLNRLGITE